MRVLAVVSADHGELAQAMYFLVGQPLEALLLLPTRLHATQAEGLGVATGPYGSADDVVASLDAWPSDVVLLLSGYLLGLQGLFAGDALDELLRGLRDRGCPVATTDPFLGLGPTLGVHEFSETLPRREWFAEEVARASAALARTPHLYPVDMRTDGAGDRLVFYNEQLVTERPRWVARAATLPGVDRTVARWLFVLSEEDYGAQAAAGGQAAFDDALAGRLAHAVRQGRQAVLVAPAPAVRAMQDRGFRPPQALLFAYPRYDVFMALLLDAEYAFYWSVFSYSLVPRLGNRLPAFFFDRGHLARAIPRLYREGIVRYWGGREPDYLDARVDPDPGRLRALADTQDAALGSILARARNWPSPAQVVTTLLGR